jgi:hypothetical protein
MVAKRGLMRLTISVIVPLLYHNESTSDHFMRAVHLWKCDCGTRLRVIAERIAAETSVAECPTCQATVVVDGTIQELSMAREESWIKVCPPAID